MPTIDADTLIQWIEESGYEARAYSGRNMYGKQCVSFTHDERMLSVLATLIECAIDGEQAAAVVRSARTDDMGQDKIMYWPRFAWPDGETEPA